MAAIKSGRYIKIKFNLCHKPSLLMNVPENSGLSDTTKRTKNAMEITKEHTLIIPIMPSSFLNDRIPSKRGTKRKSIKPSAEPTPWIFEETVTTSFDSLTLKKHVNTHAPIAKSAMKTSITFVSTDETA